MLPPQLPPKSPKPTKLKPRPLPRPSRRHRLRRLKKSPKPKSPNKGLPRIRSPKDNRQTPKLKKQPLKLNSSLPYRPQVFNQVSATIFSNLKFLGDRNV